MDNLGDWLYIVILIAVGISSLFSSAKKKKQAGQAPRQPIPSAENKGGNTPKPKSFWELLEEMQNGGQIQEETPRPAPQPVVITEKKKKTQEKKKPAKTSVSAYNSEGTSAFRSAPDDQPLDLISLSEEEAFALQVDSFRNIDDVKKAIIYSEILNRKY
ncbi:MAG: hypothetical protein LBU37_00605 [Tannerellaceae bacterium]|jgi:hypothetical protein|nr:hypothetical protein [Tannerellaceae bacterium]